MKLLKYALCISFLLIGISFSSEELSVDHTTDSFHCLYGCGSLESESMQAIGVGFYNLCNQLGYLNISNHNKKAYSSQPFFCSNYELEWLDWAPGENYLVDYTVSRDNRYGFCSTPQELNTSDLTFVGHIFHSCLYMDESYQLLECCRNYTCYEYYWYYHGAAWCYVNKGEPLDSRSLTNVYFNETPDFPKIDRLITGRWGFVLFQLYIDDHYEALFPEQPEYTYYRFDHVADFKEACNTLEKQLYWMGEIHGVYGNSGVSATIKNSFARWSEHFHNELNELRTNYFHIFESCSNEHKAPNALYYMALKHLEDGDHTRGLAALSNLFDKVDLSTLKSNLASTLCSSKGEVQKELALYDEALISLKKAIDYNPKNQEAYFNKALVLFELGEWEKAAKAFNASDTIIQPFDWSTPEHLEFSMGLTEGILVGVGKGLINVIPSAISSLQGLGHGLWAFVKSPKEVSSDVIQATQDLVDFLKTSETKDVIFEAIPELKDFFALDPHQYQAQGKVLGTIIGKYGVDAFLLYGTGKALKTCQNLKKANGALTLHTLSKADKAQKMQAVSRQWWKKTAPVINGIKAGGGKIDDKLYKAFRNAPMSEPQVRRVLHQAGFKTFAKPKGIPSNAKVQISKTGGGMVYIKPGTTEKQSVLVRVMPGKPNSPNPMQQKPYVVQRFGDKAVTTDGGLIAWDISEAHIPLEKFDFKGWEP